jgi:hypothetical protein
MKKILIKLKRFIYGKPHKPMPSIAELQYRSVKDIKSWDIKHVTPSQKYKLLCSSWFLINAHYPDSSILKKNELGANVLSKTRYILIT